MENDVRVTIITVCKNSASTIEQTIQSVMEQTHKNIEYIVIDGKSTDGTLEIIEKYRFFISKFVSEEDSGIYAAMNKGIAMASGELIAFLNADDWYPKNTIDEVLNVLKNDNIDIVFGDIMVVSEQNIMVHRKCKWEELEVMNYKMAVFHPATFVKRELFEKYGLFNTQYKIASDYDWMLRVYKKGATFGYCNKILCYFRRGGISTTKTGQCARETKDISSKSLTKEELVIYSEQIENHFSESINKEYKSRMEEIASTKYLDVVNKMIDQYVGINEKIYLFGAGIYGQEALKWLIQIGIDVISILDNDEKKWNSNYCGIKIQSPQIAVCDRHIIFIASQYYCEEIRKQIEQYGYCEGIDYYMFEEFQEIVFKKLEDLLAKEGICSEL